MPPTSRPPSATDAIMPKRGRKTDDSRNAMLQRFLPKLLKNENRRKILPFLSCGENGKKNSFLLVLYIHAAAHGGTWVLTLKIVNTLIKNGSRNDWP